MDTLQPLPARALPMPGESLASLLGRTSEAMGYENVGPLLAVIPERISMAANVNQLLPGTAIEALSCRLKRPVEELLQMTVHRFAPLLVLTEAGTTSTNICDRKTVLRYFSASSPICPRCLSDDVTPYDRLIWSLRPLPHCTRHGIMLIEHCPACRRRLRPTRDHRFKCRCGQDLRQAATSRSGETVTKLLLSTEGWLCGQHSPLCGMSTAACFWWAERLAKAAGETTTWLECVKVELRIGDDCSTESLTWLAAVDILANWPDRLEEFLEVSQRTPKYKTTPAGVGRAFRKLLQPAVDLERLGFSTPADALRSYLRRRYPTGHRSKKDGLFQSTKSGEVKIRPWVTPTDAAKTLDLPYATVVELIERRILTGSVGEPELGGRSVGLVSRESIIDLKRALTTATVPSEASQLSDMDAQGIIDLIRAGKFTTHSPDRSIAIDRSKLS